MATKVLVLVALISLFCTSFFFRGINTQEEFYDERFEPYDQNHPGGAQNRHNEREVIDEFTFANTDHPNIQNRHDSKYNGHSPQMEQLQSTQLEKLQKRIGKKSYSLMIKLHPFLQYNQMRKSEELKKNQRAQEQEMLKQAEELKRKQEKEAEEKEIKRKQEEAAAREKEKQLELQRAHEQEMLKQAEELKIKQENKAENRELKQMQNELLPEEVAPKEKEMELQRTLEQEKMDEAEEFEKKEIVENKERDVPIEYNLISNESKDLETVFAVNKNEFSGDLNSQIRLSNIFDPDPKVNKIVQSSSFRQVRVMQIKEYINSHFKGQRLPPEMLSTIDNLITSNLRNELRREDPTLMLLLAEKGLYDVDEENLVKDESKKNLNDNKDGKLSENINEDGMKLSKDFNEENVLLKTATIDGESLKSIIDDTSSSLVHKNHDNYVQKIDASEEKKDVPQQLTSPDELILLVDSPLDQEKKNIVNDNLHNEEQKPVEKLRKKFSIKDAVKGLHHHHHFIHNSNHQHGHGADHQHGHGADNQHGHGADHQHGHAADHQHVHGADHQHGHAADHQHVHGADHQHGHAADHQHVHGADHQHGHGADHQHGHGADHQHGADKNIGSEASPLVTSSTDEVIHSSVFLAKDNHVLGFKHETDVKTVLKDDNLNSDVLNDDKVINSIHETFHQNVIQPSVHFPNVKDVVDDQNGNRNVNNQNQKSEDVERPVLIVLTDEIANNVKDNSYQESKHTNSYINDSKIILDESSLHVVDSNQMESVNEKIDNKVIDLMPLDSKEHLKTLSSNGVSKVIELSPKNKESDHLHVSDHQGIDKKDDQISKPNGEFFYSDKEKIDEKQNRELINSKDLNDQTNGIDVEKPSSGFFEGLFQFWTGTSLDGLKDKPVNELDSSSKMEEDAQGFNARLSTEMLVETPLLKTSMNNPSTPAFFSKDKSVEIHDSHIVLSDTKMVGIKSSESLQSIIPSNELIEKIPLTQPYTSTQSDPLNLQDHIMKDLDVSRSLPDLLISKTQVSTKPDTKFTEETLQMFAVETKETQSQNFQTIEIPPLSIIEELNWNVQDSTKKNLPQVPINEESFLQEKMSTDHEKSKYTDKGYDHLAPKSLKDKYVKASSGNDVLRSLCDKHPTLKACESLNTKEEVVDEEISTSSRIKTFTRATNSFVYNIFSYVFGCIKHMCKLFLQYSAGLLLVIMGKSEDSELLVSLFDSISIERFSVWLVVVINHIMFYWYYQNSTTSPVVMMPIRSSLSAIESTRLREQVSEMEEELDKSKQELSILSAQANEKSEEVVNLKKVVQDLDLKLINAQVSNQSLENQVEDNKEMLKKLEEKVSEKEAEILLKSVTIDALKNSLHESKEEFRTTEEKFFFVIKELDTKDENISKLEETIDDLKRQSEEKDRFICEKEGEMQQLKESIEEITKCKYEAEALLAVEENNMHKLQHEIEVLQEALLEVNKLPVDDSLSFEICNEDAETGVIETKAVRLAKIMDSTKIKAELKEMTSKYEECQSELTDINAKTLELEEKYYDILTKYEEVSTHSLQLSKELEKKEIELTTINKFFADRENEHRLSTASQLEEIKYLKKSLNAVGDNDKQISVLLQQIEDLKEEISKNEKQLKIQIVTAEEQSHSNYIKMRAAVRECEEHKREKEIYRKRMLDIDMSPQFKKSSRTESPISNDKSIDETDTAPPQPAASGSTFTPGMYPSVPPRIPLQHLPPHLPYGMAPRPFGAPIQPFLPGMRPPYRSPMPPMRPHLPSTVDDKLQRPLMTHPSFLSRPNVGVGYATPMFNSLHPSATNNQPNVMQTPGEVGGPIVNNMMYTPPTTIGLHTPNASFASTSSPINRSMDRSSV